MQTTSVDATGTVVTAVVLRRSMTTASALIACALNLMAATATVKSHPGKTMGMRNMFLSIACACGDLDRTTVNNCVGFATMATTIAAVDGMTVTVVLQTATTIIAKSAFALAHMLVPTAIIPVRSRPCDASCRNSSKLVQLSLYLFFRKLFISI